MIVVGPLAAAVAVACAILASRAPSGVERRLQHVGGAGPRSRVLVRAVGRVVDADSRGDGTADRLVVAKLAAALVGALAGVVFAAISGWGPVAPAACAYAGFVAPSLAAERVAERRRREAERASVAVVEWLHALVASGRPLESALQSVASQTTGSTLLDGCLAHVRRDYTLGVPMHVALARNGEEARVSALVELAIRVERARDLGRGVLGLLQELRDELRATERARGLERASHVEGQLTLVLTLCYLPALALLVIIPLFVTLLSGLFGT